jgi:hypothetical protein
MLTLSSGRSSRGSSGSGGGRGRAGGGDTPGTHQERRQRRHSRGLRGIREARAAAAAACVHRGGRSLGARAGGSSSLPRRVKAAKEAVAVAAAREVPGAGSRGTCFGGRRRLHSRRPRGGEGAQRRRHWAARVPEGTGRSR